MICHINIYHTENQDTVLEYQMTLISAKQEFSSSKIAWRLNWVITNATTSLAAMAIISAQETVCGQAFSSLALASSIT